MCETYLKCNDSKRLKIKGRTNTYQASGCNQAAIVPDEIKFKAKTIRKQMPKALLHNEKEVINICRANSRI